MRDAHELMSVGQPTTADHQSLVNFMRGQAPVCEQDAQWIYAKEDLIAMRAGREHAWLDDGIEKLLRWFHCNWIEVCLFILDMEAS